MSVKGLMPKKEAQMELLKKYLQEEKYGSLEVAVKRKEGRKKERKKEMVATVENSMAASQKIEKQNEHVCVHAQSCPTLCNPRDCSSPGSSVHGIPQAGILEWVALPSSRGSSRILQGSALPSRESNLRLQHLPHCGPTESPGKPISQ